MKDRKNIPKTALPRIYFIDRAIASGGYPNTTTLAKLYQTGTATISRDIEYMRDMMNAPIKYDFYRIFQNVATVMMFLSLGYSALRNNNRGFYGRHGFC